LFGKFTSDDDFAILEDASGRVQIHKNSFFNCNEFSTGSIVALLGKVDLTGFFICEDFCFAGIPYKSEVPK
jgi:hypothetical protein